MPIIEVKLYDKRVTEETVPKIIEALTNALAESSGAAVEHIQVIVRGLSARSTGGSRGRRRASRNGSLRRGARIPTHDRPETGPSYPARGSLEGTRNR